MNTMLKLASLAFLLCLAASLGGCAMVHQKDREWLSDPVMQRQSDPLEGALNGDNFPRREGSSGGSSGAGGGCGC
ncbi:MAG: DUF4266 domain-containing protein [Fibrobacteres bacterium]|jgi:hypothetical protein|nr:DUF4266 domain-containing protein [Fibrobacterota bacterium]